jgi:peroxiredoxin
LIPSRPSRIEPRRNVPPACLAVAIVAALAVVAVTPPALAQRKPGIEPGPGIKVGNLAADIALKDLDDRAFSLKDRRGRGVVHIVFWATWCVPCLQEIPTLRDAYDKFRDRGFEVYGIVINMNQEPKMVQTIAREMRVNYPILWDEKDAARARYRVDSIPQNFLVGKDGVIRYAGNELPRDYEALVDSLLNEQVAAPPSGR